MSVIALAGNPNCGKTVLFNLLTGSHQRVGNWPGVTVEKKSGYLLVSKCARMNDTPSSTRVASRQTRDRAMDGSFSSVDEGVSFMKQAASKQDFLEKIEVVDLPGVYLLSDTENASLDERIGCEFLSSAPVDCIVNIVDGAHLERNLYLTLQLLEKNIPMIIVVNMMDMVKQQNITLDLKKLSETLRCPVVPMSANSGAGLNDLIEKIFLMVQKPQKPNFKFNFSENVADEDRDILLADARYEFISHLISNITTLIKPKTKTVTHHIDRIALHRFFGIPVFLLMMYAMFLFAINLGGAFQDFFDISSQTIFVNGAAVLFAKLHFPDWLIAILADGVGKGLNTTITFTPVLAAMFFFMSFLEDSGYMARAAFVMDRAMQFFGLPGKSFVPMIVGLGCNVPAVMGARVLASPRERILTVMMMPFMSCSARLAIFSVFAAAFFKKGGEDIIFLLYLIGILAAILTGFILRKTILSGKASPLIMELPPYHMPKFRVLCRQSWQRLTGFLWRAGRIIIPVCVIIGALNSISLQGKLITSHSRAPSLLSVIGKTITPILSPMGISEQNWPATVGLATGVLAKEVVIGTLNTLYSQLGHVREQQTVFHFWHGLRDAVVSIPVNLFDLKGAFSNPVAASEPPVEMNQAVYGVMAQYFNGKIGAFCYLLFVLLYFPCIATMAIMRRELNLSWAMLSLGWSMVLAYIVSIVVYQIAMLFL